MPVGLDMAVALAMFFLWFLVRLSAHIKRFAGLPNVGFLHFTRFFFIIVKLTEHMYISIKLTLYGRDIDKGLRILVIYNTN